MRSSVGVDVGGTFTDVVVRAPSGGLTSGKVPTTPDDPARGVVQGLVSLLGAGTRPAAVAHGTTIVTNAIVEGRGAVVGLVTTRGFRDVLEIGRQNRLHLYDLAAPPKPPPLVSRRRRLEVTERVGPDGAVLTPLAQHELDALADALAREGAESVAVCLLHAYANPEHERRVGEALARRFGHVSISSDVNAEFREYERTATTVLNAAVMPLAARYVQGLQARLGSLPLHLLHAGGGMMSADAARVRPLLGVLEDLFDQLREDVPADVGVLLLRLHGCRGWLRPLFAAGADVGRVGQPYHVGVAAPRARHQLAFELAVEILVRGEPSLEAMIVLAA